MVFSFFFLDIHTYNTQHTQNNAENCVGCSDAEAGKTIGREMDGKEFLQDSSALYRSLSALSQWSTQLNST
jgi:hypothetical protein